MFWQYLVSLRHFTELVKSICPTLFVVVEYGILIGKWTFKMGKEKMMMPRIKKVKNIPFTSNRLITGYQIPFKKGIIISRGHYCLLKWKAEFKRFQSYFYSDKILMLLGLHIGDIREV